MNFLIVRADRVGDVVLTLPLAADLKHAYPGCRVTFLVREYTAPLCEHNRFIDEVLTLQENRGRLAVARNADLLRKKKFTHAVVVSPSLETARIVFSAGIPVRIGSAYRWYSLLFNRRVKEHRKAGGKHELEYNRNMLVLGGLLGGCSAAPEWGMAVPAGTAAAVQKELHKAGVTGEYLIIHPGSGGSAVDLPFANMEALVKLLAARLPGRVVLTGSRQEHPLCATLVQGTSAVNVAGKFSLAELMAVISGAALLCANSTGPIHIAAAAGIHVVGFYPKIHQCAPQRWGPYSQKAHVFTPDIGCTNCTRRQCEQLNCMQSISPVSVGDAIASLMQL